MALNTDSEITLNDLPDNITNSKPKGNYLTDLPDSGFNLEEWIDRIFIMALKKNEWNQSRTAMYMNISRNTLIYIMEKRGLRQSGGLD